MGFCATLVSHLSFVFYPWESASAWQSSPSTLRYASPPSAPFQLPSGDSPGIISAECSGQIFDTFPWVLDAHREKIHPYPHPLYYLYPASIPHTVILSAMRIHPHLQTSFNSRPASCDSLDQSDDCPTGLCHIHNLKGECQSTGQAPGIFLGHF